MKPSRIIPLLQVILLALYAAGTVHGWLEPLELFNLLMMTACLVTTARAWRHPDESLVAGGILGLIGAHLFVGQRIAPDTLTGGAILLASLLTLYVGIQINRHLPRGYWWAFVTGYFVLYALFILHLNNAEPLFILFLMAMTACARSARLLAYYWAAVVSFTFLQPYAWPAVIILFFAISAVTGARSSVPSRLLPVFLAAGLALFAFVLLPVLLMLTGEDLHSLETVWRDPRIRAAIGRTAATATVSTAVLTLFGVPLAYAISRLRFPGRTLLLSLADLPIVIPQSVAGIALLRVFGRRQIIGGWLADTLGLPVDGTLLGIGIAQVFVAFPFLLRSAVAAFDTVDEELELTARSLGASPWNTFRRIALPLGARGIFLGIVLAWARAAGEFGAVVFIAPTPETAPVAAFNRFNSAGMIETAPLVSLLLLFSLVMFFLLQLTTRLLPTGAAQPRRRP